MNRFYRPEKVDTKEYEQIIEGLQEDLSSVILGEITGEELVSYAKMLCGEAKELETNEEMMFWGMDDPRNMPSDSRVLYFYEPSYYAVCILMQAKLTIPEIEERIPEFDMVLRKGLLGATGRKFNNDNLCSAPAALIFQGSGVYEFMERYPDISFAFVKEYMEAAETACLQWYAEKIPDRWFSGDCRREGALFAKRHNAHRNGEELILLFVYGTLMRGQSNHDSFLAEKDFVTEARLGGYALYELGGYPGITPDEENDVVGELYLVTEEQMRAIDRLEGEGSLYLKKEVMVKVGSVEQKSFVYVYNRTVEGHVRRDCTEQPWHDERRETEMKEFDRSNYVWYVSYGSNMLRERFLCYIQGGTFRGNTKNYDGADDKSLPLASMPYLLPYNMYYANESSAWDYMGVSFLDVTAPGSSYGVAYLITEKQFDDVCRQENGGGTKNIIKCTGWYDAVVTLGVWDGIPMKTLTNHGRLAENAPSQKYLAVLREGLAENYPYLTEADMRAALI